MRVRNITTCALGLAAALMLGSELSAQVTQDTTKLRKPSEKRINVSKGEVVTTPARVDTIYRSEEHTSELQSPCNIVCRHLLEKKKKHDPSLWRLLTKGSDSITDKYNL